MRSEKTLKITQRFNNKQLEVALYDHQIQPEILLLHGAVGSGKTVIGLNRFLRRVKASEDAGQSYIMTGYTLPSIKRNIFPHLWKEYGINTDLDDEQSFDLFGNRCFCFGTDNQDSYKSMRGIMSAKGSYHNEMTLSHKNSIDEAINRCRDEGAWMIGDMNPTTPNHYIFRTWIEPAMVQGNNRQLAQFNFTLYDNDKAHGGFLPDSYIKRMEKTYSGILFQQYILGQWKALEGQVYHLEELQYYEDSIVDRDFERGTVVVGYLDPAAGSKAKTGCYTSLITARIKNGCIYILDAVVRKLGVPGMISMVGEKLKQFNYATLAIEDNFTQAEYVVAPIRDAYPFANISGMTTREDKISRLIGMENVVKTKVFFPERFRMERNSDGWLLLNQLCNITPDHKVDVDNPDTFLDAPDSLEGCIRTAKSYTSTGPSVKVGGEQTIAQAQEW